MEKLASRPDESIQFIRAFAEIHGVLNNYPI